MKPPVIKKQQTPPPPPPPQPPAKKLRRQSTSVPVIRRTDEAANGRPKREIHPPPPKDLPYVDPPKKARKVKPPKSNFVAEQLKFCDKVLRDLNKKSHYNCAYPFYEPVGESPATNSYCFSILTMFQIGSNLISRATLR